ncbi:DUF1542 domain-containing protein [Leucobacter viscericola]|uniref:DUF1542 domain-containing protein n=1 Tax=Leucobacter viscericola TaxID=2714935 RepID=A0A6G7XHQ7_9MICO|nr:DUF1542 domain-containing protein [Leucobacter viscericola]QIK63901.1 DUF1542 domain-containing protein [Leucobacter viscericola]
MAEFDYRMTGVDAIAPKVAAADGMTFHLIDGNSSISNGGAGSGLGYATNDSVNAKSGVEGGYFGVGLDASGWFNKAIKAVTGTNKICGRDGSNDVVVPGFILRGPGNAGCSIADYPLIASVPSSELKTDNTKTDPAEVNGGYKRVRMTVTPADVGTDVVIRVADAAEKGAPVGAFTEVMNTHVPVKAPATLKLGFSAATSSNSDVPALFQDIRNIQVTALTDLDVDGALLNAGEGTGPDGVFMPGDTVKLRYTLKNHGPTAIGGAADGVARFYQNLGDSVLSDPTWNCEAHDGATCEKRVGDEQEVIAAWSGPKNSSVTIDVDAKVKKGTYSGNHPVVGVIPTDFENNTLDLAQSTVQENGAVSDSDLSNNRSELEIPVGQTRAASKSTVEATPSVVTADGASTSTVKVITREGNETPMRTGGGTIVLSPEFGNVSNVEDKGDGTYTATWSSTKAGSPSIGFTVDGIESPSTTNVRFTPGQFEIGDANASNFTVDASEDPVVVGDAHTITLKTFDQFENGTDIDLSRVKLFASPSEGVEFTGFQAKENKPGEYTVTVSSTVAGSKTITVKIDDVAVLVSDGGTQIADFAPGAPSLEDSSSANYTVSPGPAVVGKDAHTVTVNLKDAHGNAVLNAAAGLALDVADLGGGVATGFASKGDGVYTATITSKLAGSKPVGVTLDGKSLKLQDGGNADALFIADVFDENNSSASSFTVLGSAEPVATGGGSYTVQVKVADQFENGADIDPELIEPTSTPSAGVTFSAFRKTAGKPGEYTATVSSTVVGVKTISVKIKSVAVQKLAGGSNTAEFVAGQDVLDAREQAKGDLVAAGNAAKDKVDGLPGLTDDEKQAAKDAIDALVEEGKTSIDGAGSTGDAANVGGSVEDAVTKVVADAELAGAKSVGKDALDAAADSAKQAVEELLNVSQEEKDLAKGKIDAARDAAKVKVDAAESTGEVTDEVTAGKGIIDGLFDGLVGSGNTNLEQAKDKAKGDLVAAGNAAKDKVDGLPGLTADEKQAAKDAIDALVEEGKTSIDGAGSTGDAANVGGSVEDAVTKVVADAELAGAKSVGKDALDAAADSAKQAVEELLNVSQEEKDLAKGKIDAARDAAKVKVDAAESTGEVTDEVTAGKGIIDGLFDGLVGSGNTNLEQAKDKAKGDLVAAGNAAKDKVDGLPGLTDDEKQAAKDAIDALVEEGKTSIDGAGSTGDAANVGGSVEDAVTKVVADAELAGAKSVGKDALDAAADSAKQAVEELLNVSQEEKDLAKGKIDAARDAAKVKVDAAESTGEVTDEVTAGKTVIDGITVNKPGPPAPPVADPSNGDTVSGKAENGTTVTVTDKDGKELCSHVVTDGTFSCVPKPKPEHGDEITITVTDPAGNSSATTVVVKSPAAPKMTGAKLANGEVNSAYSAQVTATGKPAPVLTISGGKLPEGLKFDAKTGKLSGKPTKAGTYTFEVSAKNEAGTATAKFTLEVKKAKVFPECAVTRTVPVFADAPVAHKFYKEIDWMGVHEVLDRLEAGSGQAAVQAERWSAACCNGCVYLPYGGSEGLCCSEGIAVCRRKPR